MKSIIWIVFAFPTLACADESMDRAAIQTVVESLSSADRTGLELLFTKDSENPLERLAQLDRKLIPHNAPFSEVTKPRIRLQSIRFISSDIALADAENTQYGSTILSLRVPLLAVMKREASGWKITSLRIMVDLASLPPGVLAEPARFSRFAQ